MRRSWVYLTIFIEKPGQNGFSVAGLLFPDSLLVASESKRLPRTIKLTQVSEFQRVFKQGCYKSQGSGFVVLAIKNSLGYGRLGITLAKKNVASSVARNRIKRLIRESFRHHKNNVRGMDIVVIVRRGTNRHDNQHIIAALEKHWDRLASLAANVG